MSVNVYFEQKGDHRQISLLIFLEFRFIFSVATRPLIFDILREVITKILKLVIFCQMKMLDSIHTRRFIFFFPSGTSSESNIQTSSFTSNPQNIFQNQDAQI